MADNSKKARTGKDVFGRLGFLIGGTVLAAAANSIAGNSAWAETVSPAEVREIAKEATI